MFIRIFIGNSYGKFEYGIIEKKEGAIHMKKLKLEEILEGFEDSRRENSVMYPLYEILFVMIIAIMCGATSYVKTKLKSYLLEIPIARHSINYYFIYAR